jgi:DNA-binding transcriptional LysR family regulator
MTTVTMEWESRLGRRLRVRDLFILSTVVKSGGMGKAARQLAMTQPAVSAAIANLEYILGVRLLDRSPRGIEPTIYANAMLKRSMTVFDELQQSVRDIRFLADSTTGELTIGYPESIAATILPPIIERFSKKYPRVVIRLDIVSAPSLNFRGLRDRTYDLILARVPMPLPDDYTVDDLDVEVLLDDPLVVVASAHSRWARRRKIDLADLIDEPWILYPPNTWSYARIAEAFKSRGLAVPKTGLVTYSMDLRAKFTARSGFITVAPKSLLRIDGHRGTLKVLPVDFPARPWLVTVLTLKNRTLSPVVKRFIECAREVTRPKRDGAARSESVR